MWNYPRPAIAEPTTAHVLVRLGGAIIADTRRAIRTLETSHPPSYYIPPEDIAPYALLAAGGSSFCEWKGHARYFAVNMGGESREGAAWSYPDPTLPFAILRDHVAFYAGAMDACFVDSERVVAQPGGFYGGWITSALTDRSRVCLEAATGDGATSPRSYSPRSATWCKKCELWAGSIVVP